MRHCFLASVALVLALAVVAPAQRLVSQSQSVAIGGGSGGFVSDSSMTPFVIGYMPVVGGYAGGFPPVFALNPFGLPGSTVQLPTFSMFTTSTSVSVPDSGGGLLGGVQQAGAGAGGGAVRAAQSGVHVQIHDMAAMDKEILSRAAAVAPPAGAAPGPGPARAQASSAERPAMSIGEARRLREAEAAAARGEALAWYERARAADEEGKPGAAKVYYQMAARRADGELRESIRTRLEALGRR